MARPKFFRGWLIVIGGFLIMATCYTIFVNCISLFQIPITRDLHITRAEFSLCSSISALVGILASLVLGRVLDRYNARLIGSVSVGLIVLDLAAWSFVTQLWQMYALAFVTGFCVLAGTRLLISILITNWFEQKRGLAVSLALMGSGFGGVVLSPIVSWLIAAYSWRTAFLVLAAVTLVASMPLTVAAFTNRPSDVGLAPYGAGEAEQTGRHSHDAPVTAQLGWKVVRRSGAFWMLVTGFVFMGMVNGGVILNIPAAMAAGGHTTAFASRILSLYLLVVIVGKVSLGAIYDRFGMMAGTIFGSIVSILATTALLFSHTVAGPVAFAVLFGFGTCLGTVAPPLMVVNEFGKRDMGLLTGVVTAFEMVGAAVASPVTGAVFDRAHTYDPAWVALTAAGVLMLATLAVSIGMARRLAARHEAAGAAAAEPLPQAEAVALPN